MTLCRCPSSIFCSRGGTSATFCTSTGLKSTSFRLSAAEVNFSRARNCLEDGEEACGEALACQSLALHSRPAKAIYFIISVFKAHRLLYHSTLGLNVIKKKKRFGFGFSLRVQGSTRI